MKGIVMLDVAKGRRELGWEVGWADVGGLASLTPTVSIITNNDADFVAKRIWVCQMGATSPIALPDSVKVQITDGPTDKKFFREPVRVASFCSVPYQGQGAAALSGLNGNGRAITNDKGLPCPYLIRRGSTVFLEFANAAAYTFLGDIFVALEGFRVYPGESDPVPAEIKGFALPASWNGKVSVSSGLSAGLQKFGTIEMQGKGEGRFILKVGAISATGTVAQVQSNFCPPVDSVLFLNVRDTQRNSKAWLNMTSQPTLGQFMPASFFTGGGTGAPWPVPVYLGGSDKIFVDIYGDPTSFTGSAPGDIEVALNGVWVP